MLSFPEILKMYDARIAQLARVVTYGTGELSMFDVLIQAGRVALWQASKRFDPTRLPDLWMYAHPRVRGAMLDELRLHASTSRHYRKRIRNDDIADVSWAALYPCSMLAAVNVPSGSNPEVDCELIERVTFVKRAFERLSDSRQYVIQRIFFEGVSLKTIGRELKLSESRVCQIKQRALVAMRKWITALMEID
jgi:RNA polymerase sigma factor for flagellar operon FliA